MSRESGGQPSLSKAVRLLGLEGPTGGLEGPSGGKTEKVLVGWLSGSGKSGKTRAGASVHSGFEADLEGSRCDFFSFVCGMALIGDT